MTDAAAEPHITVRSHTGLSSSSSDWAEAVAIAARTLPLECLLGGPQVFTNRSALYLSARGAGLRELHLALLERFPGGAGYEGRNFTPHLTLALARRGTDLPVLAQRAQAEFSDLAAHPVSFAATSLTLMHKPGPGSVYRAAESWPLGSG